MKKYSHIVFTLLLLLTSRVVVADAPEVTAEGFFDLSWQADSGKLLLAVEQLDAPLIYQSSLPRGVGSNDIGLDRGQLGTTALVSFRRVGPRVLMIEHNTRYRADSDDPAERAAVEASFAQSVLWGFDVHDTSDGRLWVDATSFALRDSHDLASELREQGHGSFSPDASRSAIYLPRTRAFPDNTEIEATVTFTGTPEGRTLPSVVPDATAVTVHLHHSFVRLPDDGYTPLEFDPRSGFLDSAWAGSFYDYAAPIDAPLERAYVRRHRLVKTTPGAAPSTVVEPIVYYVDPGAPEPVRQALIDGASWWADAFTDAGFINGYEVRLLPPDADPMDVRYNVIQWVHRSTRGWSYGASVIDPRTGEILKGHVTLGSLRVRQDLLLAEGLLSPYDGTSEGAARKQMAMDMALARIRQLSAHEVGHTLGLEHNFAGSTNDRASVMDYPHPKIDIVDGRIDLSDAYDVGIGRWDRRAIGWGYQDFSAAADPAAARAAYLDATYASGLRFVADRHARRAGDMHPDGNLWDNGADAIAELEKLLEARRIALAAMGPATIAPGKPAATVEEALVPVYLLHRYQMHAVGKLIGGARFDYGARGQGPALSPVADQRQREALAALLGTLAPDALRVPAPLLGMLAPRPPGYPATRELFDHATGAGFDPVAPARAAATLTLQVLLEPTRAARLSRVSGKGALDFVALLDELLASTVEVKRRGGVDGQLQRVVNTAVVRHLAGLAGDAGADAEARAAALYALSEKLDKPLKKRRFSQPDARWKAHDQMLLALLADVLASGEPFAAPAAPTVPPGSPIGHGPQ